MTYTCKTCAIGCCPRKVSDGWCANWMGKPAAIWNGKQDNAWESETRADEYIAIRYKAVNGTEGEPKWHCQECERRLGC